MFDVAGDGDCAVMLTAKKAKHAKLAFLSGILVPGIFIGFYIISASGQRDSTTKIGSGRVRKCMPERLKPR